MNKRRWWIPLLLVSFGMNLGLLVAVGARYLNSETSEGSEGRSRTHRQQNREERPQDPRHESRGEVPEDHLDRLVARLGVEEEHREDFLLLQRQFFKRVRIQHQAVEQARRELHQALVQNDPDREEIKRLLKASSKVSADMERSLVEHVLEARSLLDDDVEERYLQFLEHLTHGRRSAPRSTGPRGGSPRRPRP